MRTGAGFESLATDLEILPEQKRRAQTWVRRQLATLELARELGQFQRVDADPLKAREGIDFGSFLVVRLCLAIPQRAVPEKRLWPFLRAVAAPRCSGQSATWGSESLQGLERQNQT